MKDKPIDLFNQPKPKKEKKVKAKKSADRDPNVTLNWQQEEAYVKIKEFLASDEREFVLIGRGGTGKSFLIGEVLKRRKPNKENQWYIPSNVVGICVAHQARINLKKSIPNTTTYASAVNLIMMYDPNGNVYFVESKSKSFFSELLQYKVLVIDECSMFNQAMMNSIRECISNDAKIIYMGDNCQLPPIGAENDEDSPTFRIKNSYKLTIKMRQDDNDAIAVLGDEICSHIEGDKDIEFLNKISNNFDVATGKGYSVTTIKYAIESFVRNFHAGNDVRITSYRNNRIQSINKTIRHMLWGDKAESMYVKGDMIIMNDQYSPNMTPLAYNGQKFTVKSVHLDVIDFVECYILGVYNEHKKLIELPVPSEKGLVVYHKQINKLKAIANRTRKWSDYSRYKSQFADVVYGYAVTNYKIQGSTIKGCYVDLSDIKSVGLISDKQKLQAFYVGASRPTHFLAIF